MSLVPPEIYRAQRPARSTVVVLPLWLPWREIVVVLFMYFLKFFYKLLKSANLRVAVDADWV